VTEDGYVGTSGLAMLNSEQDIDKFLGRAKKHLMVGLKTQDSLKGEEGGDIERKSGSALNTDKA
jgi:hypothetical protein